MVYGLHTFADHFVYILTEAYGKSKGKKVIIEGDSDAMEEWAQRIVAKAAAFATLGGCTPGYLNGEGAVGKPLPPEIAVKAVRAAMWGSGIQDYIDILKAWREEGSFSGLKITPLAASSS